MDNRKYMIWVIVLSVAAAAGIVYIYGMTLKALLYAIVSLCLVAIAVEDAMTCEIHDMLLGCLLVLGIASYFIETDIGAADRIIGALCVSLPMFGLGTVMKNSLGIGDVFLCCFGGFLLGWEKICFAAMTACLAAGIYAAGMLIMKRKKLDESFAFGPFICGGMWIMMLV